MKRKSKPDRFGDMEEKAAYIADLVQQYSPTMRQYIFALAGAMNSLSHDRRFLDREPIKK